MPLILCAAKHADAIRISDIHMAAFGSNAMLITQFPTAAVRDALRKSIELKARADIDDPKTTVLVVRDCASEYISNNSELAGTEPNLQRQANGKVIAFAKWAHPVLTNEDYTEPPWIWPTGTDFKILDGWTRKSEEAQFRAIGDAPCYRLTFMGTDPEYRGRGAATMMVRWGMEQCKQDNVPAYLESTLEAADFYRKLGFIDKETFTLAYEETDSKLPGVYEEISFTYQQ
ncbi:putative GNAT family acetyltransferase [Hypoxylon trugodes]|uniref:putative GNAT family acetyltransferase n=1 Tax=Hypoxylon trugodes TaxID=326681 RepID=UPI0021A067C0|nr:putative GNAT family acetyltransferase [Hypoxylon trugodes]KAI1382924.1 putative GNAT family acetyltransferase [Hypoxylon trugodes]